MQDVLDVRKNVADLPANGWELALAMVLSGSSRHAAAKAADMSVMTVWRRFNRYRAEQGLPPLPDARRGPRRRRQIPGDDRASRPSSRVG